MLLTLSKSNGRYIAMKTSAKKGTNKIIKIWFALLYIKDGIGLCIVQSALFEELVLENQHVDHRHRNIDIGEVEYRTEEVAIPIE